MGMSESYREGRSLSLRFVNKQEYGKVGADRLVLLSVTERAARSKVGRAECMWTGLKQVIRCFRGSIQLL